MNNDFKVSSMEQSQTGIYTLSNYLLLVSECGIWKSSRFGQYRKLHEGVMLDQLTNSAQPYWPTYFRGLYLASIIYKLHWAKPGIKELSIRPGWTFISLLVKAQDETMRIVWDSSVSCTWTLRTCFCSTYFYSKGQNDNHLPTITCNFLESVTQWAAVSIKYSFRIVPPQNQLLCFSRTACKEREKS